MKVIKERTIEDLHDKYIGHKQFAKVVDIIVEKGYEVTDIKESGSTFQFKINGYPFRILKEWKSNKEWANFLINHYEQMKRLEELRTGSDK